MKVISIIIVAILLVVLCSAQEAPQQATLQQVSNDVKTLNYALTLEHLEATFYTEGLARFNESDFEDAGYDSSVRNYVNLIRAHEVSHVNALTSVINSLGAAAVRRCTYNFDSAFTSVQNFISTAALLETTGASTYDGAANTLNDATLLQVAATIATVEARHSAFLFELNQQTPFPASFETALTPQQVLQAAASFFVSCPDSVAVPVIAYTLVPLSYNRTYFNQSGQLETSEQMENDDDVLNYALTLELFGNAFYSGAANFTQQDFTAAGFGPVYPYFQMIIEHETAHVAFLRQALESRGAQVAQPCSYNLMDSLASVRNALNFARILENLEVTAYDGAINSLTQFSLIQGAATIATVEARHAQFLNSILLNVSVDPAAYDSTNTPAQILNITAPFFGSNCQAPRLPVRAFTLQEFGTTPYVQPTPVPPTPSPVPSPCPSAQPTATPSTICPGNNNNGGVTINFYFADLLRGM